MSRRTKLVSVPEGTKDIEVRIAEVIKQYNITEQSLIDIRYSHEKGKHNALVIYDPDKRDLDSNKKE